jgi:cell division protein FtsL
MVTGKKLPRRRRAVVVEKRVMTSPAASVYRIFRRADGPAASVRGSVIALVVVACALCGLGLLRVEREHEVLQLGYQLSQESARVQELRETRRRLEVELATLTSPERIRRLASQLGMVPVAPDHIRVIDGRALCQAGSTPGWECGSIDGGARPRHEVASQP